MPVRPGGAQDPASRLERLLRVHDARFRRAFRLAIRNVTDQNTLDALADLLEQGRLEQALEGLAAAADLLGGQYGASLTDAANDAARFLSTALTVNVNFDQTNERAVENIRNNRLRLIREFNNEQRRATRAALMDGITRGINPRDQARQFRDSIGLTERQVGAVNNYRRLLTSARMDGLPSEEALNRALRDGRFDRRIQRAIREGTPLSQAQVDQMVERYRQRYINYRAEVIARTESLRAVHQGNEEMYQQAIDAGQFQEDQVRRTWVTARDERVRASHMRLNGEVRGLNEVWEGDEGVLRYPGDPAAPASETVQCRCVVTTRLNP